MQVLFVFSLSSTDGRTDGRTETVLEVLADLKTKTHGKIELKFLYLVKKLGNPVKPC